MKRFKESCQLKNTLLILSSVFVFLASTSGLCEGSFDQTHAKWTKVLSQSVVIDGPSSRVKYAALAKETSVLDSYLSDVSAVSEASYNSWNDQQKLAFLFNAYNAFTVKFIINGLKENPSLKSIKNLGGIFSSPWKKKFFKFLGQDSSLDHIEQDIARKNFDEPRLHMAFNCASIGCPALGNEAFRSEKLNQQLDDAAKSYLNDKTRNRYDAGSNSLFVSSIFKWYGGDFENSKTHGPLRKFITDHMALDESVKKKVLAGSTKIEFLEYDWNLNRAAP